MNESAQLCGVVLAGGASRRMGQPKAALLAGGEPLLHRVVRLLSAVVPEVIVVGSPAFAALVPENRLVPDAFPGRGPLGGLRTAFDATAAPWLFLVACDMPFLRPPLIRALVERARTAEDADALALRGATGLEPLHACYSRRCLAALDAQIAVGEDWSMRDLLARLQVLELPDDVWVRFDPERQSATNINTPEEWAAAQVLLRGPSDRGTQDSSALASQ